MKFSGSDCKRSVLQRQGVFDRKRRRPALFRCLPPRVPALALTRDEEAPDKRRKAHC
jgi:hypothetical protein